MRRIIFDIETAGEDFDSLDETSKEVMTSWIRKVSRDDSEYSAGLEDIRNGMGFSPLTGEIVAIGLLDADADKGAVYYQPGKKDEKEIEESGVKLVPMNEEGILKKFWELSEHCNELIGFNSRAFDMPFIAVRSAIYGIKTPKNFMANRFTTSQPYDSKHIDLADQLTFYGAVQKKGSLHMWCRAFGIKSPKEEGVKGEDVTRLFREGESLEIARYNARDLFSTRELYHKWDQYLRF